METEMYRGLLIESAPSPSEGAYGEHWFNVSRDSKKEFEAKVRVSEGYAGSLEGAKRIAAEDGLKWVHDRIDESFYVPGDSYRVEYKSDSKVPRVTLSR